MPLWATYVPNATPNSQCNDASIIVPIRRRCGTSRAALGRRWAADGPPLGHRWGAARAPLRTHTGTSRIGAKFKAERLHACAQQSARPGFTSFGCHLVRLELVTVWQASPRLNAQQHPRFRFRRAMRRCARMRRSGARLYRARLCPCESPKAPNNAAAPAGSPPDPAIIPPGGTL